MGEDMPEETEAGLPAEAMTLAETPPVLRTPEAIAAADAVPHAAMEPEVGVAGPQAPEEKRVYAMPSQDIIVNGVKYPAGQAQWIPVSVVDGFHQYMKLME